MRRRRSCPFAPAIACLLTACGGSSKGSAEPPPPPNAPPTLQASAGVAGAGALRSFTLPTGATAQLEFTASDPDGDPLQWQAQTSAGDAAAAGLSFQTPVAGDSFTITVAAVPAPTAAVLNLLVEDPRGGAAAIDLQVVRSGAPTILAVTPDSAFTTQPQQVTITGSALSLGGSVATTASFDGTPATGNLVVDDTTLTCSTPVGLASGPTVVSVAHVHGSSQLPDSAFTAYTFPPLFAATDTRLDAVAGTAPQLAQDGAALHGVWLEGDDLVHRASYDRGATWTAAQPLSGGETAGEPQVAVVGADVVVAWTGDGTSVVARTSHDGGQSFAPAQVLDSGTPVQRPRLAASGARRYLVWQRGDVGLGTARLVGTRSTNGGDDWAAAAAIGDGGANQYDAELACDGATAWLAFVDERDGQAARGVYFARTTNSGTFWQPAQRRSLVQAVADTPRLCHDAGRVWLAWLRAGALEFMGSADAGLSWPTVAAELRSSGLGPISEPRLTSERDRLYAIYLVAANEVAVTRVGGIGATPQHTTVSTVVGPAGEPCVQGHGNYVFAAWRDGTVAGGSARLVQCVSVDLGATFTAPAGLGDGGAAQAAPQLLLDGARVWLAWLDYRTTPPGVFSNRTLP
jgi:hypothetical protein